MDIIQLELDIEKVLAQFDPENALQDYYRVLANENEKINLVSRETIKSQLPQLCAESLLPFTVLDKNQFDFVLDIGSGGGLPAFPILMTQNVTNMVLIERIGKKAAALNRMAESLEKTNVEVFNKTVEDCKFQNKFDLVTMRLVKLHSKLLNIIFRNLSKNSIFVYYHKPEFEIDDSRYTVVTYSYSISTDSVDKFFSLISKNL